MASAHHQQAPTYAVPHGHGRNEQQPRLPSLRAMDFYQGHGSGSMTQEYPPPSSAHHPRQEPPTPWQRSTTSSLVPPPQQQHAPPPQTRHAEIPKSQPNYTPNHSGPFASPQPPPPPPPTQSRQTGSGGAHANTRGDIMQQQPTTKRSSSSLSETPGRSPQTAYPPHASYAPVQGYHQNAAPPPSAEQAHHPSQFAQVGYQYPPQQPPPPMNQGQRYARAHPSQAHQAPPVHQSPVHPSPHQLPQPVHRPPSNHQQHSPAHQAHQVHQVPPPQNHPPTPHSAPPPPAAHQPLPVHHSQQPHHSQPPPHHPSTSHQSAHQPAHQPPPPVPSGHPPSATYPPQAEHWSHPPPSAPPQAQAPASHQPHQAYENYARNVPPISLPIDPRSIIPSIDPEKLESRRGTISKIVEHCNELYQFASRYANPSGTPPSPAEIQEMTRVAQTVVRLLEDLRSLDRPSDQPVKEQNGVSDEQRPPKRPWEDMARDDEAGPSGVPYKTESPDEKPQSTAEADMELIRSKRATSSATNIPGQPKSKYRKRSRATPPGKCHSCNIRETPEWRRGPDGARTLCNACGLHYAKLMRKRDKAGAGSEGGKPITIESLRASTASARGGEHGEPPSQGPSPHHHMPPPPPPHPGQVAPPPQSPYNEHASMKQPLPAPMHSSHHASQHPPPPHPSTQPGPGQYHNPMPMPPGPPPPGQHPHHMMPPLQPPPNHANHPESGHNVASWMASPPTRGYTDHQSYMRTSHAASHTRASPH